jgi:DNA-binding transcriptional MocR family regulator
MVDQGPGADRAPEQPAGRHHPGRAAKQLLRLASDFDIQIVEDDIYGELMFEQGKTKALKAFDRLDRVIYCSSFSKTLSPGVRVGWMIAGRYQDEIQRLQTFTTHSACSVTQMGVAAYLEMAATTGTCATSARSIARTSVPISWRCSSISRRAPR